MWEIALPFVFGAAGLGAVFAQARRRLRSWHDAATACGLEVTGSALLGLKLRARAGAVEVRIEPCGNKGQLTRIAVSAPWPPDFYRVSLQREPLLRWAREIEIGDGTFDGTFFLDGSPRLVLALLDEETRRLLLEVNSESRLEISQGELRAEGMPGDKIAHVLRHLLEAARRLARPMDVLQHLAENARYDAEPGVRLQNLLLLVREHPGENATREALETARSDSSAAVRLRAAQALGPRGRDVLLELAESLVDDAVSAEAVSCLDRELTIERTEAILGRALAGSCRRTAHACLEALGRSGNAAAETPLLQVLRHQESDLRMAAATALGRVGSAEAVLPLKEVAERSWLDLDLRRATRQSIAEIQSRLQGASPGQLSLSSSEAGQLALTIDEAGQLSLAPSMDGRLALAPPEQRD